MSSDLRDQLIKLLNDITGDLDKEDEGLIVSRAYQKLSSSKRKVSEESMLDAILAAFQDDTDDEEFQEYNDKFKEVEDDLLSQLRVSSYDDKQIDSAIEKFEKTAASLSDLYNGAEGSYYDEKGKSYLPKPKPRRKPRMDEFEIKDGPHDGVEYHNEATKTESVHRTRADMLSRSAL